MGKIIGGTTATPTPIQEASNTLRGFSNGGIIDDISSIPHNIICKIKSKNKIPSEALTLSKWKPAGTWYRYFLYELEVGKTYCFSGYSTLSATDDKGYLYVAERRTDETAENIARLFQGKTYKNGVTFTVKEGCEYYLSYYGGESIFNSYYDLMIEEGSTISSYAPHLDEMGGVTTVPVTVTVNGEEQVYYPDADGNVIGIPHTTKAIEIVAKDNPLTAVIECEYNRDINKAFEELRQAIISLGGNV